MGRSLRTRSRLKWRFLFGDCPAVQYGIDKTPHWPQIIQSIWCLLFHHSVDDYLFHTEVFLNLLFRQLRMIWKVVISVRGRHLIQGWSWIASERWVSCHWCCHCCDDLQSEWGDSRAENWKPRFLRQAEISVLRLESLRRLFFHPNLFAFTRLMRDSSSFQNLVSRGQTNRESQRHFSMSRIKCIKREYSIQGISNGAFNGRELLPSAEIRDLICLVSAATFLMYQPCQLDV